MKKVDWKMDESFVFPISAGMPVGAETVNVTPRFTEERTEDAVRLSGIYHISTNVKFDEEQRLSNIADGAILIDDVDLDGYEGYFEYAVPLNVDLPSNAQSPISMKTLNFSSKPDGQGRFTVNWDVECSFTEQVLEAATEVDQEDTKVAVNEEIENEEVKAEIVSEKDEDKLIKAEDKATHHEEKLIKSDDNMPRNEESEVVATNTKESSAFAEAENVDSTENQKQFTIVDHSVVDDTDEVLAFIGGLEDRLAMTTFRSNDVFVERES